MITIHELGELGERLRSEGLRIVLAHGVFDVLHVGHLRHLREARSWGDVLVVSVTDDPFVNKGPDRPHFTAAFRGEMLNALELVDYVVINPAPTSEPVLRKLKPSVYAKGQEYADADKDVTGNIERERTIVNSYGGEVRYTEDITFSSSSLINAYFAPHNEEARQYLSEFRQRHSLEEMLERIDGLRDLRVLILGDVIIDEYRYVTAMGRSAKESVLAVKYESKEQFAGGVVAAANHLAGFCKHVELVSSLGTEKSFESFVLESLRPNIKMDYVWRPDTATTRKIRYVDRSYLRKLHEVYHFDDRPLPEPVQTLFDSKVEERLQDVDLVIVTDFGHGLIADSTIKLLAKKAPFLAVNCQTNAANRGYNLVTKYSRADFVCVDRPEAQLASGNRYAPLQEVIEQHLAEPLRCPRIIVTNGKEGCVGFQADSGFNAVPAFTQTVVDTVGAGDAFFVVTAPYVYKYGDVASACFVGNAVGALKVGIVGHRKSVDRSNLHKYITALMK